jgi:hypothetical protein
MRRQYTYGFLIQFVAGKDISLVFIPGIKEAYFQVMRSQIPACCAKMNLRLSPGANVNFIEKLSLVQEYQLVNDSTWFLAKDKFIADFAMLGKNSLNFVGRKTTTYRNIIINDTSVLARLENEKLKESVDLSSEAMAQSDSFWISNRHEELNKNEKAIYQMTDTLLKSPAFKSYSEWINFIATGYKNVGNYQIGPWFRMVLMYTKAMRFDLGTNYVQQDNLFLRLPCLWLADNAPA